MSNFFDDVDEAIKVYRDFNLKYHDERISIYNNVEMILKTLKENGYKLGVVTSKNKATAFKGLNRFNISRYFDVLVGSDDVYDLIAIMESHQVYESGHVDSLVELYLNGAERDRLDPILDACTAIYKELDDEGKIEFKSAAKAFVRTYGFLGAILPYGNAEWEKLSIFLNLLIPKLPSPKEDDLSQGILDSIDLDSYRVEARDSMSLVLDDADAEIGPVPCWSCRWHSGARNGFAF